MKIDKWFLMILIMLVIFSLWAIIVTGNANSGGSTVYMPLVTNGQHAWATCGPFDIWWPYPECGWPWPPFG